MLKLRSPLVFREYRGNVCLVTFSEKKIAIHSDSVEELSEILIAESLEDEPYILIDMEPVDFICSGFIELLIRVWNRMKCKKSKSLALCGLDKNCHEVLDVTHLTTVIGIYPTRRIALAEVNKLQVQPLKSAVYLQNVIDRTFPNLM